MKISLVCLLMMFVCLGSMPAFAQQIALKNGEIFEAVISEQNQQYIKVNRFGVNVTYFRNEIDHISTEDPMKLFVSTLKNLDQEVEQYLNAHSDQINQFSSETQKNDAIGVVLEETKFINEKILVIQQMSPPEAGQMLKTVTLDYYQSMLELQAAVLKYLADTPQADELVKQRTTVMIDKEKQFQTEMKRLIG